MSRGGGCKQVEFFARASGRTQGARLYVLGRRRGVRSAAAKQGLRSHAPGFKRVRVPPPPSPGGWGGRATRTLDNPRPLLPPPAPTHTLCIRAIVCLAHGSRASDVITRRLVTQTSPSTAIPHATSVRALSSDLQGGWRPSFRRWTELGGKTSRMEGEGEGEGGRAETQ